MIWISIFLTLYNLLLAFLVGYLLLLTTASRKAHRLPPLPSDEPHLRFRILVPAHNEERLLPDLLDSLDRLDYPKDLFTVHIVADNCTDRTAAVPRPWNMMVYVRDDRSRIGKGYALNWLADRLHQVDEPFDAVVFFDADSVVSPNFLRVIAAHLEQGERAIQSYYAVRDPAESWAGSLRYAALAVLHYLRPLGRMYLGASAGLKGNGMAFSADLWRGYSWSSSLTEDIELHMALLLSGERVAFAPEAVVYGEMPNTLSRSASQHMRWEQGKLRAARTFLPRLLAASALKLRRGHLRQALVLLDAAVEFIEPPFSLLFGANIFGLAASVVLRAVTPAAAPLTIPSIWLTRWAACNILLAVLLLIGQGVYLFWGLHLVSAPRQVYGNLLYAPRLVLWKIWQMAMVLLVKDHAAWVRTRRNQA